MVRFELLIVPSDCQQPRNEDLRLKRDNHRCNCGHPADLKHREDIQSKKICHSYIIMQEKVCHTVCLSDLEFQCSGR